MEMAEKVPAELLRVSEDVLRQKVLQEARVTNFERGYVSVPSVNQLVDMDMQLIAGQMIADHYCKLGVQVDKVVGIPNSGISLATSVAQELRLPLAPGRKGDIFPSAWDSNIVINEKVPSFTTKEPSKFVFNGLATGDTVLMVDDFIALGATSVLIAKKFQEYGIKVQVASYMAKLFQGGVDLINKELGIKPFFAVGIKEIYSDGGIALTPSHY